MSKTTRRASSTTGVTIGMIIWHYRFIEILIVSIMLVRIYADFLMMNKALLL